MNAVALLERPAQDHRDDPGERATAPGATLVFSAAGRSWIVGMSWNNPMEPGRLQADARAAARERRVGRIAVRQRPAQYGVPHEGMPPGTPRLVHSAAAGLADTFTGSWCGAWPLHDGPCIVMAAGPHGLLPDGDQVIPTVEEAKDRLRELLPQGSWRRVYAPEDWAIGQSKGDSLEELLGKVRRPTRLVRPPLLPSTLLPSNGRLGPVPMAVMLAAALGVGIYGAAALRGPGKPASQRTAQAPAETPPPVLSWAPAADRFEACLAARDRRSAAARVPRWPLSSLRCAGSQLEFVLQASPGATMRELQAFVPDARLQPGGAGARLVVPVEEPAPRVWPAGTPMARAETYAGYFRSLERAGAKTTVGAVAALPGQTAGQRTATWTLNGALPVAYVREALAPLAAAELSEATFDPITRAWTLNGVLHVAP